MSTFFNLKKAFFLNANTQKRIHKYKNAQAINQGVRGAEPPDAGKFFKETVHIVYSKFPIFGGSGGKNFGNFFIFTIKSFRWNFAFVLNFS